jgi:cyclase
MRDSIQRAVLSAFILAIFLLLPGSAGAASVRTRERSVTKIADGVYVIAHQDATDDWPQGNTVVIVGERETFVVDSCFLPSSAREDVAEIRRLSPKPVRFLFNTHWHIDHNAGNSVYMEAFPGLQIIAQSNTREGIMNWNRRVSAGFASPDGALAKEIAALKKSLSTGNDDGGKPLSADDKAAIPTKIDLREKQMSDYRTFRFQAPTMVFDHELSLDLGNREVQMKFLGRGNTAGDGLVYLPKEKIVITGDLLVSPVPYMRGSFPIEWRNTLRDISALDADVIVPGHGAVQHDKTYLNEVIALLDSVLAQVREQAPKVSKTEDLHIDVESFRKSMAGDDPENNLWWKDLVDPAVVERAFLEVTGRL